MSRTVGRRAFRCSAVLTASAALSVTLGMSAEAQRTPATDVLPRRVSPGDTLLHGERITSGRSRYSLTMYRDADEIPVGRLTDAVRVDTIDGTAIILRVQQLQRGTVTLVDSTTTHALTLAPRTRRALQQNRRVRLEFIGRRVKGAVAPLDVPPVPLDTTLALAPFDASNWELLLRALPLEQGFAARFPVYEPDVGLREYRVVVTGSTAIQGEPAHVVTLTIARNRESVVWVSQRSGLVLQIETLLGETTLLRQVLVREPLPAIDRAASSRPLHRRPYDDPDHDEEQ